MTSRSSVSPGIKKLIGNLLLFILVSAITLFIAEGVLRFCFQIPSHYLPKVVRFENALSPSKRLRPGLNSEFIGAFREFKFRVTTDANGFRRTDPFELNEKLKPEIVVLGDSQTFGVGVNDDQTFASGLSRILGRPVLNTGCPGYNNYEEYALAQTIASYLKPKTFVLAFFAGNDPYENYKEARTKPASGLEMIASHKKKSALSDLKEYWVRNSALYNLIMRLRRFDAINRLFFGLKLVNETPPAELEIFRKKALGSSEDFWDLTDKAVLELQSLCHQQGIELVVLFIPDRYQVDRDYWAQWLTKYRLDPKAFDLGAPNSHMQDLCLRNGIPFIDPTNALKQGQVSPTPMYWYIDNHLAPAGHEVIARELAAYFTEGKPVHP